MFSRLEIFDKRYSELEKRMYEPDVVSDPDTYREVMKEYASIEPVVKKYREYKAARQAIDDALMLLDDADADEELRTLAGEELDENKRALPGLEEELKILLLPKDPNDDRNVIVEIRGGTGGEESSLFAYDLFRMYSMYAERRGYKIEVVSLNETGLGGYKEVSFIVSGQGAYSRFKFESGTHRVQRVPQTESSGRIHTSAATVAVLPEADDVEVEINPNDIEIDTFRSSGAGGQHINKTSSAIRITHKPTGIVVECQDERSQYKNKDKAMKVLRSKLYEMAQEEQNSMVAEERRSQVGTGDRSERIRTYNYPQGRVTDHRIGLTIYRLDDFFDGDMQEMIDALITTSQAKKLESGEQEF